MRKILTFVAVIIVFAVVILSIGYVISNDLEIEEISLNLGVADTKIVHVSDLHYPDSFPSLTVLAETIIKLSPDCIVMTGDIADASASKEDIVALGEFFRTLSNFCLCFLSIGNHEIGSEYLDFFVKTAWDSGVIVLLNEIFVTEINSEKYAFIGLSDGYPYKSDVFKSIPALQGVTKILMTHRPEKFTEYASSNLNIRPDVVFAGHAHGGVMRLGRLALYAPNQGLFPKYTSGIYETADMKMIVSRGLGVSGVDLRTFNKYHLPVVTLH